MLTVFVNPERCIGCLQCEFACAVEHSHTRDPVAALGESPGAQERGSTSRPGPRANTAFPNKCRHCDPAPCLQVCPTGAISRDAAHDVVLIDTGRCIACAMCAMVCPFDVITYHPLGRTATPAHVPGWSPSSATACIDRVREGTDPACVEVCKVGALAFGEINELVAAGRGARPRAVLAAASSRRGAHRPRSGHVRRRGAARGRLGGPPRRCAMTALDRTAMADVRRQPAIPSDAQADAGDRPRRGHPDRLGPPRRPRSPSAATARSASQLPQLLDGPVPHRPVR